MPEDVDGTAQLPRERPIPPELVEPFARMAGILLSDQTMGSILDLVASLSARTVPGVDGASVTLVEKGRLRTAAYSDDLVRDVDNDQYELGQGPCVDASTHGRPFYLHAGQAHDAWPAFRARATDQGISSILSLPLRTDARALGALNLYSRAPDPFDEEDQITAKMFADQAAISIANANAYVTSNERASQLLEALETRDVIGQAKGIIMAAQRCTADEAFDIIRRASQRQNRKLRELAHEIVEKAQQAKNGPVR